MKECREIRFANEPCKLIVRAEVRGSERRERYRIEVESLANRRDELSRAID